MQFQQDRAARLFGYLLAEQLHALMDESHCLARLNPAGIAEALSYIRRFDSAGVIANLDQPAELAVN